MSTKFFAAVAIAILLLSDTVVTLCPEQCSCAGRIVSCRDKGFETAPSGIPGDTIKLDLSGNKLSAFTPDVPLNDLVELDLSKNVFTSFGSTSVSFPSLERLVLARNYLSDVEIGQFAKLKFVDLQFNRLTRFAINNPLLYLSEVNLNFNALRFLDLTLGFPQLKILRVGSNRLTCFDGSLLKTPALVELDLTANQLSRVGINGLPQLKFLRLIFNSVEKIFFRLSEIRNIQLISYQNSPLHCDCCFIQLLKGVVANPSFFSATCVTPVDFAWSSVSTFFAQEINCTVADDQRRDSSGAKKEPEDDVCLREMTGFKPDGWECIKLQSLTQWRQRGRGRSM